MPRSAIRRALTLWMIASALLVGCTADPIPQRTSPGSGALQVSAVISLDKESTFVDRGYEFELILSQDNQTRTAISPMKTGELTLSVDNLFAGIWSAALHIRDHDGDVTHAATGDVIILPEEITAAQFLLMPEPGELHVMVDLSGIDDPILRSKVQGARVYVSPGGYSTGNRDADSEYIEITRSLQPQSYDYQVVLYGDNFLVGEREYKSPWDSVDIAPGKVTSISWTPSVGQLDVRGTILDAPQAPTALQGEYLSTGSIRLSWEAPSFPSDALETGIRIYERKGIFDAYDLVDEVPGETTSWGLLLPSSDKDRHLAYVVTAYATYAAAPDHLYESSRSGAVELFIPLQVER